MRAVAGQDYRRAQDILRWPLRELLIAYVALLRERAERVYMFEVIEWSLLQPHSKKKLPQPKKDRILKRHVDT